MESKGGIYKIQNTANGKRYIGSAVSFRQRFHTHRSELRHGIHHSQALQRAWNKYGESAFRFVPMLICDPVDLIPHEQLALDGLKPEYNICKIAGSPMLGRRHTPEVLAKISRSLMGNTCALGYRHSQDSREQMSRTRKGRTGKPHTEATKNKISAANRGKKKKPFTAEHCAAISAGQRGRIMSATTRAALLAANTGRALTEAHKEKLRAWNTGKVMSPEAIEKSVSKRRGRK